MSSQQIPPSPPASSPQPGTPQKPHPSGSHVPEPLAPEPRVPGSPDGPTPPRGPQGFGWGLLLVILVIGSGTLMAGSFPYSLIAPLFSAGALLLSVLMLRPLLRRGVPGAAKAMGIILVVVTAFSLLMSLMALAVAPLTASYRECISISVTQSGQRACDAEYQKTLQRISGLQSP